MELGTIRDRVVGFLRLRAGDLEPHPQNWRRHPEAQSTAMLGILADIGFADVLLVRELVPGSGRYQLLDGHLRAETVPEMEVPCVVLDLDEHEARKLLVTHDPLTAMAEQDARNLAQLLAELDAAGDLDVAKLVWPDYVVQPLLAAEWAPADRDSLESGGARGSTLILTPEERSVFDEALAHVRATAGPLTPGACLVRICRVYLETVGVAAA